MEISTLETIINSKIHPFKVKNDSPTFKRLLKGDWTVDELKEACEIGTYYLRYSKEDELLLSSADTFIQKLGGILHNRRLKAQDPEYSEFVNDLTNKLGISKSWKKSKALADLKFIYKAGYPVPELYKLCAKAKTWDDILNIGNK
jgi:hypothetical protein